MDSIHATYAAFNARDVDAVLAQLAPDVDWPTAWGGGRAVGHAAVRDYWTRQFAAIVPTVEPRRITERPDGRVEVEVHQVVRALDGALLSEGTVVHTYTIRDGLIARMDITEP